MSCRHYQESYIPDHIAGPSCTVVKCLYRERSISLLVCVPCGKRKRERIYSPSVREKSGKATQWQPSLCHVLSRSARDFTVISPPSLPLRKRKVYDKQHSSCKNDRNLAISVCCSLSSLPLLPAFQSDSHLHFPRVSFQPHMQTHTNMHKENIIKEESKVTQQ